jgi:hypothetical protein
MSIAEELQWIQQLIDRLGVTGTLRLIGVNCADRAEENERWAKLAELVFAAARQASRIEPERMMRDDGEKK